MILEAARRLQSPEVLGQVLGDLDRTLVISSNARLSTQNLTLSPSDAFVLSRVDGVLTAREAFQIIPLPQEDTERSLFSLLCTGMVEFLPKTGAENDPWSTFTSREQRILMLMTCGRTNREIASVIAVHESVVAATIQQLMHRTGAVNRPSLIAYYLYHKLFRNEALPAMDAAYQN